MKKNPSFILVFMSLGLSVFFMSCKNDERVSTDFEFDYFPQKNVYHNVATGQFIYSIDGAQNWDSMPSTKEGFAVLGKKEKVYSKTPEVWKNNASHVNMHNGKAFKLVNANLEVATNEEVSDRRSLIKTAEIRKSEPAKRKGIKGFFDKVFKKKDKKN